MDLDPLAEIVAIPPGACLGLDDHFAMSTNAVRHLLVNMRETDTRHAVEVARCNGARRVAESQRDDAIKAADEAGWWQRWGPAIVAGALVVGAVAGGTAGYEFGRK